MSKRRPCSPRFACTAWRRGLPTPAPAPGLFGGQTMAEPDYPAAAKWARRAAEAGSAEGQAVLGFILTSGPENLRNVEEGDRWYEKSAAGGCPQGQLGYALVLARDTSRPRHPGEAAQASQPGRRERSGNGAVSLRHGSGARHRRAPGPRRRRRLLQAGRRKGPSRRPGPLGLRPDGGQRRRAQPGGR